MGSELKDGGIVYDLAGLLDNRFLKEFAREVDKILSPCSLKGEQNEMVRVNIDAKDRNPLFNYIGFIDGAFHGVSGLAFFGKTIIPRDRKMVHEISAYQTNLSICKAGS